MHPVSILTLVTIFAWSAVAPAEETGERHFLDRVKPLLDSRCVSCHGPDKQKGALRLDSRPSVLKGGENGPAIVPGEPSKSLLLQTVTHAKKDLEMPPKEKLTTNDIAILERWVRDGALWPETAVLSEADGLKSSEHLGDAWNDPRNPVVRVFGGQRLDLWSLKPIAQPPLPAVRNSRWVRNPIDRFVLARLEAAGLEPAPEALRRTLMRRLTFDLIGLPPTPEEVEAFLRDRSADAWEKVVDRLLNSPRYGEHQARLWLDVIRYSDSNGFDWDEFRPRAWRFRDYVIRSYNDDKPFDRFVREQLAGDELCEGEPRNTAEQDALIATGYLRLGPHDNAAPLFNEQDRSRAELMADLVDTTSSAFLGLTMSCCRCHDHKFDPLLQADHFRMRAFFEPVKFADDLPLDLREEQQAVRQHNEGLDAQLKPLQKQREEWLDEIKKRLREERVARLSADEKILLDLPQEKQSGDLKGKFEGVRKKVDPSDKEVKAALKGVEKERHDTLVKEIEAITQRKRPWMLGLLMTDAEAKPPVTRVLFQGDHKQPKQPVEAGFISALDPNPAEIHKGANPKTTGRRLTLADWIVSPRNPLTARVLVNRLWQSHFGSGLVGTPNDFGLVGERPTDPELLDWLANELVSPTVKPLSRGNVESGAGSAIRPWSIKRLHRLIVTSATYRQASRTGSSADALYAGHRLRRLSAEQLRDALLAVAGTLQNKAGGPPVWPDLPAEILQANPAFLDDNETKTKGWYPSLKPEQNVRSVYLVQKRTVRVPFMETFDLPENATSCARRNNSTVAPQALSLLNSPMAAEAAAALAGRVDRESAAAPGNQVEHAFALALQRPPDRDEMAACERFLHERSLPELCRALLNLNEFIHVD